MAKGRRRGFREGSIYQRSDSRWVAQITVSEPGQRQRTVSSYHATQAEAIDGLDAHKARLKRDGVPEKPFKKLTLGAHLDNWLEGTVRHSVRALTFESYGQHIRVHLKPVLGQLQIEKLTAQHVRRLLADKLDSGLSPRTVRYSLFVLKVALDQALDDGLVVKNVAASVKPPKYERRKVATLDIPQARKLIEIAAGERLGTAYLVGLSVGRRRGELLGLEWTDINLDERTLTVRQALERIRGRLQFVPPKSETSRRTIALPAELVPALRQHRARQAKERLQMGQLWHQRNLVFTTGIGTPIEPRNLTRDFKRVLRKAEMPDNLTLHSLRYSMASLLLRRKVHPRVVMEILGHSQISLTMNTYSHVMPITLREAADEMSAALTMEN